MAGRGPAPQPDEASHGHHAPGGPDAPDPIKLSGDGIPAAYPELPEYPGIDAEDWHPWTLEWWAVWHRSPMAARFTETDWRFLIETAPMYDRFVRGDMKLAGELRLRLAKLGYTIEDRQRLRMKLQPKGEARTAPAPKPGSVTRMDDRRNRIVGA